MSSAPGRDVEVDYSKLPTELKALSNVGRDAPLEDVLKAFGFIKHVLNGHIFVRIDSFRYGGKIIIPGAAKRQPTKGLVVAADPALQDVKVGDRVLYSQFAGYLLKFEDIPLARCLSSGEVLAVLSEESPDITLEGA